MAARICCLDLDTFFVSVERLLNPALVGVPVVVGGLRGTRGVVTAASYEVRPFGVKAGMPMARASRIAPPETVFVPTEFGRYSPYSERVREVLERCCPVVRPASIDEFYLDWSGCEGLYRRGGDVDDDATIHRVVQELRERIREEIGLPCSAGIAATRAMAKMASALAKPDGTLLVPAGHERAHADLLPVRRYPGIGPKTEERLHEAGIRTLGQLLDLPPGPLRARFGGLSRRVGEGLDPGRVTRQVPDRPAFREHDEGGAVGSISNERTFFADIADRAVVRDKVRALAERVCWRARQRGVLTRNVGLKLRYSDFRTLTRSRMVPSTCDETAVFETASALLEVAWTDELPVRLVGVVLSHLEAPAPQLDLPLRDRKRGRPGAAIDAVRERFGYDRVRLGSVDDGTGAGALR